MSHFLGLNISASALFAYQAAINTTANNLANVQTEGYTRQTTTLEATAPTRMHAKYGSSGTGVQATEIKQERDIYYDTKYWGNNASQGYFEQRLYYLQQVETVFTDDGIQEGFSTIFSEMFNGLDTLNGGNASDESVRNQFIHQAQSLCTYFNAVSDSLTELQKDTNEEILNDTSEINSISQKIALLNREVNRLELNGGYANELRDERALLLDQLSALVNVETHEYEVANTYGENLGGTNFRVIINGQILVDGNEYRQLECVSDKYRNNQSDAQGMYTIVWKDTGMDFAAATESASGKLKALFDLRDGNNNDAMTGNTANMVTKNGTTYVTLDNPSNKNVNALAIPAEGKVEIADRTFVYESWEAKLDENGEIESITFALQEVVDPNAVDDYVGKEITVGKNVNSMGIPYYQQQMNEFLRNFVEMFNDIQKKGQTLDGEQMGAFFVGQTKTGTVFDCDEWGTPDNRATTISSKSDGYHQITVENIRVNKTSLKDPRYFATTVDVTNGADAYDLLKEMQALEKDTIMYRGTNAGAFLETLLSDISVDTEKTTIYSKNYSNIGSIIQSQRASVSGVDEDEEAMNLIKYQNAYNLSSKMLSIFNELYDKLINQTGL